MKTIKEIETYAIDNKVPIIDINSLKYINELIKEKNIKSMLELGAAIGYSSIMFSINKEILKIITIERDIKRYTLAEENIKDFALESRISLIKDDIFNVELKEKFDLIFIDAAKSQNKKFLEKFENNLNENGIIIIDNMNFHGLVGHSSDIKSKNLRALVKKIELFILYLENQNKFKVKIVNIGDTMYILERNKNE